MEPAGALEKTPKNSRVVRKNSRGVVRQPSQGDSRDATRQGSDGPRRIAALEAGAGVLGEAPAGTRAVAGCLDPRPCAGDLCYSAAPTRAGGAVSDTGVPLSSEQKCTLSRKRLNMLDLGLTQRWRSLPLNSFRYELFGVIWPV